MRTLFIVALTTIGMCFYSIGSCALIKLVAAENIYGAIAQQIGGQHVEVVNIMNNPLQDPHLFTVTPSIAKKLTDANIIIYNGANYDPWILPLIPKNNTLYILNVADFAMISPDKNPHIWYIPDIGLKIASVLKTQYIKLGPAQTVFFNQQYDEFASQNIKINEKISYLKQKFQNTPVIATESIFNYMAKSVGLIMHGQAFQLSIMNDIPPSISEIKNFENNLRQHKVKLLIYNKQVINPLTQRLLDIAKRENISVLGVTEMLPSNLTYTEWILEQLNALERSLEG